MKKLFLFLSLLLFNLQVYSQDHHAKFGIRVGGASTSFFGQDISTKLVGGKVNPIYDSLASAIDNKWSFTAGFYINAMTGDHFWLKTDINFVNRGNTYELGGKTLRNNFYWVDIYPLSPTIHVKGAQLFVGPTFSFLILNSKQTLDSLDQTKIRTITDTELENHNRFDIGMVGGLEYEFPFGLNLGVRYVRGFSSVAMPEKGRPRVEQFNKALLVTLGYTLGRHHHHKQEHHD